MKRSPIKTVMVVGICLSISACAVGSAKPPAPASPKPVRPTSSPRPERSRILPVVTILGRGGKVVGEIGAPGPAIVAREVVDTDTDTGVYRSGHRPKPPVETPPAPDNRRTPSISKEKGGHPAPMRDARALAKIPPASSNHGYPPVSKERNKNHAPSRKTRTIEPSPVLSVTKTKMVSVVVESASGVKVWRVPTGSWRLMRWRAGGIELVPSHARPHMGLGIKPESLSSLLVTAAGEEMRLKPGETAAVSAVRPDGSMEELTMRLTKEMK